MSLDEQHREAAAKLTLYQRETAQALAHKEISHSVGAAQYQLRRLDASDEQRSNIEATTFKKLVQIGDELQREHYENLARVRARESDAQHQFVELVRMMARDTNCSKFKISVFFLFLFLS